MWKILLAILLVTVSVISNNTDIFEGSWIPVVFYPAVAYFQTCVRIAFYQNDDDSQCICADRNDTQLIHSASYVDGINVDWGKTTFPYIEIKLLGEVAPAMDVNCTCGDIEYPTRAVGRPFGDNYFVLYKALKIASSEPNSAIIYAREVPAYAPLLEVMMNIDDLRSRDGEVMCTSEFIYAEMISRMKIQ